MESREWPTGLVVVEFLWIKLANIEIFSQMFRMAGDALGFLVCMKSLVLLDSCGKFLVAIETLCIENILVRTMASVAILDAGIFLMGFRQFSRRNKFSELTKHHGRQKKQKDKKTIAEEMNQSVRDR